MQPIDLISSFLNQAINMHSYISLLLHILFNEFSMSIVTYTKGNGNVNFYSLSSSNPYEPRKSITIKMAMLSNSVLLFCLN